MKAQSTDMSMWRYATQLPLADPASRVSLGEGWTPLLPAERFAREIGCHKVWIKDESQNPTGTFKDRSAAYTISWLKERGCKGVVLNSTGNASAAFAVYAARAGIPCLAIVPADVLTENLLQMHLAGAEVHVLDDWSQARSQTKAMATERGFTDVSADCTPTREQAKQTVGLEIVEQLGRFPDAFFCPTGGGIALLAVRRAFEWLASTGGVPGKPPRLFASQFAGCSPIAKAFEDGSGLIVPWDVIDTPRGGMRTPNPRRGAEVLDAVAQGGAYAVEPADAAQAARLLARDDGILVGVETGSALVALRRAVEKGLLGSDSTVVILSTTTPLKSDPAVLKRSAIAK
ncbi:pyridoxal-phosphate dependent enzyme [Xanthomonas axonopodis]|uniref:pyridoxal-phosphate dependent enzyme n=1 Tax=Xanthomonas axonopodis TaxID=53413 RepID=UPI0035583519